MLGACMLDLKSSSHESLRRIISFKETPKGPTTVGNNNRQKAPPGSNVSNEVEAPLQALEGI